MRSAARRHGGAAQQEPQLTLLDCAPSPTTVGSMLLRELRQLARWTGVLELEDRTGLRRGRLRQELALLKRRRFVERSNVRGRECWRLTGRGHAHR